MPSLKNPLNVQRSQVPSVAGTPFNLPDESQFANGKTLEVLGSVASDQGTPGRPSFIPVALCHLSVSYPPCRVTSFRLSLGVLALLTLLGTLGIANSFLDEYLDLNVAKKLRHF